jgi:capsular polysaccharide biosynthesis protein
MDNLSKEETQLKASLAQYQNRLNLTPVREQQLTGLLRDYDLQKQNYADLVNKELQSQLATNLEKDQGGRQFRLVDPPSLPVVPSSPKRLKINLGGAAGGVFLGLALAFLKAMRDRSFHTEKQVSQRFGLPLVVGVPMLLTPSEKRSRTWRASFEWLAGSVLVFAVCAVEFYSYRRG